MKTWHIPSLDLEPRLPEILSSTPEARAIALDLRTGEGLPDHEVHERAWIVVIAGDVEISSASGETVSGGSGLLVEVAAAERHGVVARSDSRLLLLLTPWPGTGHPGAMTLRQKLYARRHAAKQAGARPRVSTPSPQDGTSTSRASQDPAWWLESLNFGPLSGPGNSDG